MPKYRVLVQRYVEETAAIEVDAPDVDEARDIATYTMRFNPKHVSWGEGDDITGEDVYAVLLGDEMVWES
jgi:hypothetical protein